MTLGRRGHLLLGFAVRERAETGEVPEGARGRRAVAVLGAVARVHGVLLLGRVLEHEQAVHGRREPGLRGDDVLLDEAHAGLDAADLVLETLALAFEEVAQRHGRERLLLLAPQVLVGLDHAVVAGDLRLPVLEAPRVHPLHASVPVALAADLALLQTGWGDVELAGYGGRVALAELVIHDLQPGLRLREEHLQLAGAFLVGLLLLLLVAVLGGRLELLVGALHGAGDLHVVARSRNRSRVGVGMRHVVTSLPLCGF